MKSNNFGNTFRKYARILHRDLSYFISGMILIYAISGIAMNHRSSFNPDYSVSVTTFTLEKALPAKIDITKEDVLALLAMIDEEDNYTKHYFPEENTMKVFLKGGSNLMVNLKQQKAQYEKLTRRPVLSAFTRLHYNLGQWWTWFSDFFAVGLLVVTLSGIFMVKGRHGLRGWGGIALFAGIALPLLFLLL